MIVHVISVSGGKDSLATALLALDRIPREQLRFIFCDTQNEDQIVYDYLDYLERTLSITIERLRANFDREIAAKRLFIARDQRTRRDKRGRKVRWSNKAKRRALAVLHPTGNAFLDLCLWKGRFPSRKAQFCTEHLKRNMAVAYQIDLADQGHRIVSWQGVRRNESHARANAKKIERVGRGFWIFRPIVEWDAPAVFALAAAKGIDPNPLYRMGMTRVGCMPCINVGKAELAEMSRRLPHHVSRISDWEVLVGQASKRGFSTWFGDSHPAKDRRIIFADLNIWSKIQWAKTTRGGTQFDLLRPAEDANACSSAYGLCE